MTSNTPTGPEPTLTIGQAVGQAEASLTRLLNEILAEKRTSRRTYLALQRLNALGGEATREAYERDLGDWLELDGPAARTLASDVISAGLAAAADESIRLTAQGRALRGNVLATSAEITGLVLATLDREDVATTIRTLEEITRRARGIPVRRTTTEEYR